MGSGRRVWSVPAGGSDLIDEAGARVRSRVSVGLDAGIGGRRVRVREWVYVAPRTGLEPATSCTGGKRSIR